MQFLFFSHGTFLLNTFRIPCYPWLSSPSSLSFSSFSLSLLWLTVRTKSMCGRVQRVYMYGMYGGRQTRGQVEGCATCCSVAGTRANSRMSPLGVWLRVGMRRHTGEEQFARGYSNHNGASLSPRVYIRICVHARVLSLFCGMHVLVALRFASSLPPSFPRSVHLVFLVSFRCSARCTLLPSHLLHPPSSWTSRPRDTIPI